MREIADWVRDNLGGLPDLKVTVRHVVEGESAVAWEWTYSGTYTGQFPGAPEGKGQAVTLEGMSVMEIENGEIARETHYFDNLAFLTQIGVTDYPTTHAPGTD